jgi:hypothetical protein
MKRNLKENSARSTAGIEQLLILVFHVQHKDCIVYRWNILEGTFKKIKHLV